MARHKPTQRQMTRLAARAAGMFSRSNRGQAIGFHLALILLLVASLSFFVNPPLFYAIIAFFIISNLIR